MDSVAINILIGELIIAVPIIMCCIIINTGLKFIKE